MKAKTTSNTKFLKKLSSVMTAQDKEVARQKVFTEITEFHTKLSAMIDAGKVSSTGAQKINDEAFKNNPLWVEVLYNEVLR